MPARRRTAAIVASVSVVALVVGLGVLLNESGAREDEGGRAVAPRPPPEPAPPVSPPPSGGGAPEPEPREASADPPKPPESKPVRVAEPVAVRRPPEPVAPRSGTQPRTPDPRVNTPPRVAVTPDRGDGPGAGLAKTPRRADLEAKLRRLESAVREGRFSGGPAAALLLEDARDQLAKESPADRVELQNILDTWERKYLRP